MQDSHCILNGIGGKCIMKSPSEYRAASRRHRAWVFSLVAPAVVDTSYCVTPLGSRSTTSPILSIRYLRSFAHLLPAHPCWLAPVCRHATKCPLGIPCHTASRSNIPVRSSPCDTA